MAQTPAERQKRWRERYPDKVLAFSRTRTPIYKEQRRAKKRQVMTYYGGGKCACVKCGEARMDCLSIDHIAGNGASKRRKLGFDRKPSATFYNWLVKSQFPKGYQTLCMNCQWVKRFARNEHN